MFGFQTVVSFSKVWKLRRWDLACGSRWLGVGFGRLCLASFSHPALWFLACYDVNSLCHCHTRLLPWTDLPCLDFPITKDGGGGGHSNNNNKTHIKGIYGIFRTIFWGWECSIFTVILGILFCFSRDKQLETSKTGIADDNSDDVLEAECAE